jgi:glycyl-tRNA synthetase
LINNETLAYFMARTQLYMERWYGPGRLRFRQHLTTEMAHYAACWDLEIKVELRFGSNASDMPTGRADLTVRQGHEYVHVCDAKVDPPVESEFAKLKTVNSSVQAFKQDQRVVSGALEELAENWKNFAPIATALETEGRRSLMDSISQGDAYVDQRAREDGS